LATKSAAHLEIARRAYAEQVMAHHPAGRSLAWVSIATRAGLLHHRRAEKRGPSSSGYGQRL
jgi:hypothetical protein